MATSVPTEEEHIYTPMNLCVNTNNPFSVIPRGQAFNSTTRRMSRRDSYPRTRSSRESPSPRRKDKRGKARARRNLFPKEADDNFHLDSFYDQDVPEATHQMFNRPLPAVPQPMGRARIMETNFILPSRPLNNNREDPEVVELRKMDELVKQDNPACLARERSVLRTLLFFLLDLLLALVALPGRLGSQ